MRKGFRANFGRAFLYLTLALQTLPALAAGNFDCSEALITVSKQEALAPQVSKRATTDIKQLNIGSYNTYNLLRSADGRYQKPEHKQKGLARPILDNDLDIVVLQEVNDLAEMKQFAKNHLNDQYESLLLNSNDSRGIRIAFYVKRDLPFRIELATSRDIRGVYEATNEERRIFSRDVPAMRIWAPEQSESEDPLMTVFGTHFKSKRSKDNDPESRLLRGLQNEAAAFVIDQEKKKHPKSLILFAGDFNGSIHEENEFLPIRDRLVDSLEIAGRAPPERVTHTFHPRDGPTSRNQIDAIFLEDRGRHYVRDSYVHRYQDPQGSELPIPDSWEERNANPSDHYPVILNFDFQRLFQDRSL
jgi:endonuclease/exonuclease/phosphatase family metal-dependent hydrolase